MRSLEAASLSAEHVQRRPLFDDTSPKTGNLSRFFAVEPVISAPPPPKVTVAPPAPRVWPEFPVHPEERRQIEARGECVHVTHADLVRKARTLLRSQPTRKTSPLPRYLAGVLRVVGLGGRP